MQEKYSFFQYEDLEGIWNQDVICHMQEGGDIPFYLFDMGKVTRNIKAMQSLFGQNIKIAYAMKANPWIAQGASTQTDFVEVCSQGELELCKRYGINGNRIVVDGIFKSAQFVELALELHVRRISIDSKSQLQELLDLSVIGSETEVLLRVGSGNQFGMDEGEVLESIHLCRKKAVRVVGIHYYSGTCRQEAAYVRRDLRKLMYWVDFCSQIADWDLQVIEFGAGIGVPCFESESADRYIEAMDEAVTVARTLSDSYEVIYEVGRDIAASAGIYVTKVFSEKRRDGKRMLFCMGGSNQLTYYGGIMGIRTPIVHEVPKIRSAAEREPCMLCGSLCNEGDVLARECFSLSRDVQVGDCLAFFYAGAYSPTESPNFFLAMEMPAILLYNKENSGGEKCLLLRRSCSTYDLLHERKEKNGFAC